MDSLGQVKTEIEAQAERIIHTVMMEKIKHLGDLYEKTESNHCEQLKMTPGGAAVNKSVIDLSETMKREILELVEDADVLKQWITLNVPKIEDGNNFGVGVQEEIVGMLVAGKTSGLAFLNNLKQYHIARATMVKKVLKYPGLDDYRMAVSELDNKQYLHLRNCARDLRNNYAVLFDMLTKNMDKLTRPKGSGRTHQAMY